MPSQRGPGKVDCLMRVVHLLRKLNSAEWGGTETAMQRLVGGLHRHGVESVVYCPQLDPAGPPEPFGAGCSVRRFHACCPVWGVSAERRRQMLAVGGNLMSFDLLPRLWREPDVAIMHTHALGRLGGMASMAARWRGLPLVVTIHGGLLDLSAPGQAGLAPGAAGGWEWGKLFGLLLQSRRLLHQADAILVCNPTEAALLREKYPGRRIVLQPHGVPVETYQRDCREAAHNAFPEIAGRSLLLSVGRIDPVKNQRWLVEQAPEMFRRHPHALLVLAGACTDEAYGAALHSRITERGLRHHVFLTGGLPPADPRLIGLMQAASVVLLPSLSETFGLVILEAWAAGAAVIATRTSGAASLIRPGQNGWLFDLNNAPAFHEAVDEALHQPAATARLAAAGRELACAEYDTTVLAGRMKRLYEDLIEEKGETCATSSCAMTTRMR